MRIALAAVLLAALPAFADAPAATASSEPGYHARLYQRYCDKLKEGPEAYAAFVKRLSSVHGYTFTEFAPRESTDQVRAVCRNLDAQLARAAAKDAQTAIQ